MLLDKIKKIIQIIISKRFYSGVKIKNIVIKNPIYITKGINFGDNIIIWDNARIEVVTKYNKKKYNPNLVIEDNVSIQQNCHITCGEELIIGKGTSILENVGIFDIIHPYTNIDIPPYKQDIMTKKISIGENCLIGMNSVILPGSKLGNHNVVGAGSVVNGEFPDYCVLVGSPAKMIKKYNKYTRKWERV